MGTIFSSRWGYGLASLASWGSRTRPWACIACYFGCPNPATVSMNILISWDHQLCFTDRECQELCSLTVPLETEFLDALATQLPVCCNELPCLAGWRLYSAGRRTTNLVAWVQQQNSPKASNALFLWPWPKLTCAPSLWQNTVTGFALGIISSPLHLCSRVAWWCYFVFVPVFPVRWNWVPCSAAGGTASLTPAWAVLWGPTSGNSQNS